MLFVVLLTACDENHRVSRYVREHVSLLELVMAIFANGFQSLVLFIGDHEEVRSVLVYVFWGD